MTSPRDETPRLAVDARGVVWLAGPDRLDFLHRLATASLDDLAPGTGRATFLLSDTGRALDLMSVHHGAEGTVLITSTVAAAGAVAAHLKRYVLFGDDVRVTDASRQVAVVTVLGCGPDDPPDAGSSLPADTPPLPATPGAWLMATRAGEPLWRLRHPANGLGGEDLVAPRGAPAEDLARTLADALGAPGSLDPVRVARLLPAFGAELGVDDGANPLEVGRRDLVDFAKGCYVGQEVVARLDTYDRVQRRLVQLRWRPGTQDEGANEGPAAHDSLPRPGARIFPEAGRWPKPVRLTSAVVHADGSGLGLALVPRSVAVGDPVVVGACAGVITALAPERHGVPAAS